MSRVSCGGGEEGRRPWNEEYCKMKSKQRVVLPVVSALNADLGIQTMYIT